MCEEAPSFRPIPPCRDQRQRVTTGPCYPSLHCHFHILSAMTTRTCAAPLMTSDDRDRTVEVQVKREGEFSPAADGSRPRLRYTWHRLLGSYTVSLVSLTRTNAK